MSLFLSGPAVKGFQERAIVIVTLFRKPAGRENRHPIMKKLIPFILSLIVLAPSPSGLEELRTGLELDLNRYETIIEVSADSPLFKNRTLKITGFENIKRPFGFVLKKGYTTYRENLILIWVGSLGSLVQPSARECDSIVIESTGRNATGTIIVTSPGSPSGTSDLPFEFRDASVYRLVAYKKKIQ